MSGIEMQEPLEEKRKKLGEGVYDSLDKNEGDHSVKKAFDSLDFGSNKSSQNYNDDEIRNAITRTVQKGITISHLPDGQKIEANKIIGRMDSELQGKNTKEMLEAYAAFRTKLMSVLGTGNAMNAKPLAEFGASAQDNGKKEESAKFDFVEEARKLGERLLEKQKQDREKQGKDIKAASNKGSQESGLAQRQAFEVLSGWPK